MQYSWALLRNKNEIPYVSDKNIIKLTYMYIMYMNMGPYIYACTNTGTSLRYTYGAYLFAAVQAWVQIIESLVTLIVR